MSSSFSASINQVDTLLNASLNGTIVYKTVYNESGQISDFTLIALNEQARNDFNRPTEELLNQSLLELLKHDPSLYLFRQCALAVESGRAVQYDTDSRRSLDNALHSYTVRITPIEGGVVASYIDITLSKQRDLLEKQQNELLDRMIQTAPSAIALHRTIFNEAGQIVDFQLIRANQLAFNWMNVSEEDAYQKPLSAIFQNFRETAIFRHYTRVAQTGEHARFERHIGPNWYEFFVAQFDNSIIVTVNEATKRKQTELALKQQTETLEGILDAIPAGVFVSEAIRDKAGQIVDFKIVEANAVALLTSRRQRSATIGQLASVIFPQQQYETLFPRYESVVETKQIQRFEYSILIEGARKWVDTQLSYLGNDRVISSFSDITPIREAEFATQQQSELLRKVIDNVQVGIGLIEAVRDDQQAIIDFHWVMSNEAIAQIAQLPTESESDNRIRAEDCPDSPELIDVFKQVIATGEPFQKELNGNQGPADGWFDTRIVKQGDGVLIAVSDITKRKLAELELERQNHFLQRANLDLMRSNENLQQFAYVASHDLQEPLRKIIAFGDMLSETYGRTLPPEANDMITRMQTAARRMSLLIRDLLTYSRISVHPEKRSTASLNQLVTEAVDNLYVPIEESGAQIQIEPLPDIPGDPVQLEQLFQNLLSNAIKFGRSGVKPIVRVFGETKPWNDLAPNVQAKVHNPTKGPMAVIHIQDNGIGFDEQYTDRVFQVFQRLHSPAQFAGSGIGLAICRRVAENHGGTITAQSRLGEGATFTVYLPIQPA
ncbi:PAS domain-containing sensor histidine kinase [Rudanella lutea]|uniref:PAS domain-containing sensor histidine kinase n=1 Tax=Rudanella lutea TaxID=451374 RepID=UPI00035FD7E3|nr:ATP-binding protein [Rudanella lutea]